MKTTHVSVVAVLLAAFSPWLLAAHLLISFGREHRTPLTDQVSHIDNAHVRDVIDNKRYGNLKDDGDGSFTPLSEVILYSRMDEIWTSLVEDLIRHGAQVNEPTIFDTPLQTAAYKNDLQMMRLLVRHGAQVDFPNCQGETPLMKASMAGNREAIIELLAMGANSELRNNEGLTAQNMAKKNGVKVLLDSPRP